MTDLEQWLEERIAEVESSLTVSTLSTGTLSRLCERVSAYREVLEWVRTHGTKTGEGE